MRGRRISRHNTATWYKPQWWRMRTGIIVFEVVVFLTTTLGAVGLGTPSASASVSAGETGAVSYSGGVDRADPANVLSRVMDKTLAGGYVSAGVGMRDLGYDNITISGIPTGSRVVAAYLMWDVLDNSAREFELPWKDGRAPGRDARRHPCN